MPCAGEREVRTLSPKTNPFLAFVLLHIYLNLIDFHHTWSRYLADMGRFDDAHTSVRRLYGIEAGPFETHETVTHELNTLPTRSAAEREGTGFAGCFTTATRWRPSFMLLYALVTSAHSGGGLQVSHVLECAWRSTRIACPVHRLR